MKSEEKLKIFKILRMVLVTILLISFVYFVIYSPNVSVEDILKYTPENPPLAALSILILYSFKGTTMFFPMMLIEIASGHLFSLPMALSINILGVAIVMTIPYWLGHFLGMEAMEKLIEKYPKFHAIIDKQQENSLFLSFFLRIMGGLPGDLVTMYMGASKTPYFHNLIGGVLGSFPSMALTTLLGSSIKNPQSPNFWLFIILKILLSGSSFVLYYFYRKHKEKFNNTIE